MQKQTWQKSVNYSSEAKPASVQYGATTSKHYFSIYMVWDDLKIDEH